MSPEQRDELMRLSAQAFGSPELMAQLDQLDDSLRALRPGEDLDPGLPVPDRRPADADARMA
jgi:uncharacterized protein with von Willebrand factor type A (vWA) domain